MIVGVGKNKNYGLRKILLLVWGEFVYGGHLLSLGASAIVLTVTILLSKETSIPLLVIAYLVTQIAYILNHFKELKSDAETNPERTAFITKQKKYFPVVISVYFIILLLFLISFSNLNTWLIGQKTRILALPSGNIKANLSALADARC